MGVRVLEFLGANTKDKDKPNEDFLHHLSERVFAVADGATRFVPQGKKYPNPSIASTAAEIFCKATTGFVDRLIKLDQLATRREEAIEHAFALADALIHRFNEGRGITKDTTDYLENDFASCLGVFGLLMESTLYYGYIGDCGLLVFNNELLPTLITNNQMSALEGFRDVWDWSSYKAPREARRLFWNKSLRNNPEALYLTYGELTGEKEALSYVKTGRIHLKEGDISILFSDGIEPYLFCRAFRECIKLLLASDKDMSYKCQEIEACLHDCGQLLLKAGYTKNLDDDKALIALQLV